jgi:hypothetical protein
MMPVPEAPMNEYNLTAAPKDEVRGTGQVLCIKAISESKTVYDPAHNQLGFRILGMNKRHPPASFFPGKRVHCTKQN